MDKAAPTGFRGFPPVPGAAYSHPGPLETRAAVPGAVSVQPELHDRFLLAALARAERTQAHDQEACTSALLIESQLGQGLIEGARTWWHWTLRLLDHPLQAEIRSRVLSSLVQTAVWLNQPDLSASLQAALPGVREQPIREQALAALTEHSLSLGNLKDAETRGRELWALVSSREALARWSNLYVRVLRVTGQLQEAQTEAVTVRHLSLGLPIPARIQARLALLTAFAGTDPPAALSEITDLEAFARAPMGSPVALQLAVYQALAQYRSQPQLAQATLRGAGIEPARLSSLPLRTLMGLQLREWAMYRGPGNQSGPTHPVHARTSAPELELEFLGPPSIRQRGFRMKLRPRFADLLVALALHPDGLTGEQLALYIYGDAGSPNCCKTELSRLRQLLPIETRPYRLTSEIQADFLELPGLLAQGLNRQTLDLYRGPLLRSSDAPVVREHREWLEELLRQQLLLSSDPALSWRAAAHFPDDVQVWETMAEQFSVQDPRHSAVVARLAILHRA